VHIAAAAAVAAAAAAAAAATVAAYARAVALLHGTLCTANREYISLYYYTGSMKSPAFLAAGFVLILRDMFKFIPYIWCAVTSINARTRAT
jgi:opacity protein-like surface antigen